MYSYRITKITDTTQKENKNIWVSITPVIHSKQPLHIICTSSNCNCSRRKRFQRCQIFVGIKKETQTICFLDSQNVFYRQKKTCELKIFDNGIALLSAMSPFTNSLAWTLFLRIRFQCNFLQREFCFRVHCSSLPMQTKTMSKQYPTNARYFLCKSTGSA